MRLTQLLIYLCIYVKLNSIRFTPGPAMPDPDVTYIIVILQIFKRNEIICVLDLNKLIKN